MNHYNTHEAFKESQSGCKDFQQVIQHESKYEMIIFTLGQTIYLNYLILRTLFFFIFLRAIIYAQNRQT